jgi:hypothetical protein
MVVTDKPVQKRTKTLRVVVSGEEAACIAASARATGLSVSHYLRNVGLGDIPKSSSISN